MDNVVTLGLTGLFLLFLEMFLPGMIAGIAGGVLLLLSVILAYKDLGSGAGNLALLVAVLTSSAMWWWWAKYFQHTRFGKMMTHQSAITGDAMAAGISELEGKTGTAFTALRPAGIVMIQGRQMDALTNGEFIERDSVIQVVRAHGSSLLVCLNKPPHSASPSSPPPHNTSS